MMDIDAFDLIRADRIADEFQMRQARHAADAIYQLRQLR